MPSLHQAQHALWLTARLVELRSAFDSAGIPWLTFKGPTLSWLLYGDFGSRAYVDVDVLIPRDRVVDARRLLASSGYTPHLDLTDPQLDWFTGILNEYAMRHPSGVWVELHWAVVRPGYRFSLSYEDLAEHRTTIQVAGQPIPTLSRDALALVLAVHGAKHGWSRRSWITDFADLTLAGPGVDWDHVMALAARHHATRFVLQGVWLAREELGRTLPSPLTRKLARDRSAVAAARLAQRSWQHSQALSYASYALAMGDLRSRATALREVFLDPTPLDCALVDLPRSLFPLYYGVRPLRLVFKHLLRKRGHPWSA